MTQTKIFVADTHVDLEERVNAWLREHQGIDVHAFNLVTQGETNYALLVAWKESGGPENP